LGQEIKKTHLLRKDNSY